MDVGKDRTGAARKRMFLHIGMEKTGTKTLQKFLSRNPDALGEHGFVYPHDKQKSYVQRWVHSPIPGTFIATRDFVSPNKWPHLGRVLDDLAHDLATDPRHFILSSEHLSSRCRKKADLEQLKSVIDKRNVTVVCYVRRQDELALSAYSTAIRAGGRQLFDPESVSLLDPFFNFFRTLDLWASVFGDDHIAVRVYDRSTLLGNDIRDDFLSLIGIADSSRFHRNREINHSLGESQLKAFRWLNQWLPRHDECSPRTYAIVNTARNVFSLLLPTGAPLATLLDGDTRMMIMERFREANNKLERRFLQLDALQSWYENRHNRTETNSDGDIVNVAYRAGCDDA